MVHPRRDDRLDGWLVRQRSSQHQGIVHSGRETTPVMGDLTWAASPTRARCPLASVSGKYSAIAAPLSAVLDPTPAIAVFGFHPFLRPDLEH
jgi:hypothetical protein